ncbi:unnamed protein product, partial [Protopolystoma xenopodis]
MYTFVKRGESGDPIGSPNLCAASRTSSSRSKISSRALTAFLPEMCSGRLGFFPFSPCTVSRQLSPSHLPYLPEELCGHSFVIFYVSSSICSFSLALDGT